MQVPRLVVLDGAADSQLESVRFQGATTASKSRSAPSDKGSVMLTYTIQGRTVSLREYNSGPGPLVVKLRRSNGKEPPEDGLSVMTLDGSSYQLERNAKDNVVFVEWKTLNGLLIVLNGGVSQSMSVPFVQRLVRHIH